MTDSCDLSSQAADWFAALPERFRQSLQNIPVAKSYYVALSGGLDSSLLLALSYRYLIEQRSSQVTAIHVHHGLSQHADHWQAHCQQLCDDLGVKLLAQRVVLESQTQGVEEAARNARYQVFKQILPEGAVLLQGHHQNDQAETVLLRLMRGAGVAGIAGIPQCRALGSSLIYRPFLELPRSALFEVAQNLGVIWIEDDSNENIDFDRNFIRHEILPVLEGRWRGAVSRLAISARHCRESVELEAALAQIDLDTVKHPNNESVIAVDALACLSKARQANVLRYWIKQRGLGFPGEKKFQRIWVELLNARSDATPLIEWGAGMVRRYRDGLFLLGRQEIDALIAFDNGKAIPLANFAENRTGPVNDQSNEALVDLAIAGRRYRLFETMPANVVADNPLINDSAPTSGLKVRFPDKGDRVVLRFRQGGELFKPKGRAHHRPLKKWLHDCNVPPWLRDSIPLLYYNERLIAVGDLLVSDGEQEVSDGRGMEITWGYGEL